MSPFSWTGWEGTDQVALAQREEWIEQEANADGFQWRTFFEGIFGGVLLVAATQGWIATCIGSAIAMALLYIGDGW